MHIRPFDQCLHDGVDSGRVVAVVVRDENLQLVRVRRRVARIGDVVDRFGAVEARVCLGEDVLLVLERSEDPSSQPPDAGAQVGPDVVVADEAGRRGIRHDVPLHARNLRVGIRPVVEQGVRQGRVECARWSREAERRTGTRDVCGSDRLVRRRVRRVEVRVSEDQREIELGREHLTITRGERSDCRRAPERLAHRAGRGREAVRATKVQPLDDEQYNREREHPQISHVPKIDWHGT